MSGKAIYRHLVELLGRNWKNDEDIWLHREGYVGVHFDRVRDDFYPVRRAEYEDVIQEFDVLYSLGQSGFDKWGGLSDPLVVFRIDPAKEMISVVSQEDWFHHDGHEPRLRFRKVRIGGNDEDVDMQKQLNQDFLGWLQVLNELGYRPSR